MMLESIINLVVDKLPLERGRGRGGRVDESVGKLDSGSFAAFFGVVDPRVEQSLFAPFVIPEKRLGCEQRNMQHVRGLDQQLVFGFLEILNEVDK